MLCRQSTQPSGKSTLYSSNRNKPLTTFSSYLVAITSILGFCIMPRGKFIQTMSLNVVAICLAAAINLFALYTITQARIHTTPPPVPGAPQPTSVPYNSSASAVCAIWLLVQTYFVNTLKVARPQYNFPCILYSIFLIVSST